MEGLYLEARKMFLKMAYRCGLKCPIKGVPIDLHSDIHHKKGRSINSYADQWAKDNDIPILIDPRFFLGVSREGHQWIETHPKQARELGYTLTRLDTIY